MHIMLRKVLDRFRKVCSAKGAYHVSTLLDTKGPEIRTSILRCHTPIELIRGETVKIVAVGDNYTRFEG